MVPFIGGCMSSRAAATGMPASRHSGGRGMTHAWDVILRFYELKMGHEFNSAPARKLSQSFGLDLSNSTSTTGGGGGSGNRQALLTAVGHILATHAPYKRSPDAMFKALVRRPQPEATDSLAAAGAPKPSHSGPVLRALEL